MYDDKSEFQVVEQNPFLDYLKTVPVGEIDKVKGEIISRCKITFAIYRHWKCGSTKIPPLAQPIINEIAGKEIFKPSEP